MLDRPLQDDKLTTSNRSVYVEEKGDVLMVLGSTTPAVGRNDIDRISGSIYAHTEREEIVSAR